MTIKPKWDTVMSIPDYENGIVRQSPLDKYLTKLFENTHIQKDIALFILHCIHEDVEGLIIPNKVYTQLNYCNKNTFYKTLNRLKEVNIIRKEGKCYRYDSAFSFNLLQLAMGWINYAGLRNQKNDFIKSLLEGI